MVQGGDSELSAYDTPGLTGRGVVSGSTDESAPWQLMGPDFWRLAHKQMMHTLDQLKGCPPSGQPGGEMVPSWVAASCVAANLQRDRMRWEILGPIPLPKDWQPLKGWPPPGSVNFNAVFVDEEGKQVPSSNPVIPVFTTKEIKIVNARQLIGYDGSRELTLYDPLTANSTVLVFNTSYDAEDASHSLARWLQSSLIAANPNMPIERQNF